MFKFNSDARLRDEIIFGEYDPEKYVGGIRSFKDLGVKEIKKLVELKFADPMDAQNDAPAIKDILSFITKYPKYKVSGYVVAKDRSDYRTTIDSIYKNAVSDSVQETKDFENLYTGADEISINKMSCWFD